MSCNYCKELIHHHHLCPVVIYGLPDPLVETKGEDFKEPLPKEKFINRLKTRREFLKAVQKYTQEARGKIFPKYKENKNNGMFELLIAVEQLENLLRRELNWELEREGLNKLPSK